MATAKRLPSGNWRVNKYIERDENGKRIYKSFTARTKREAEFKAQQYIMTYFAQKSSNDLDMTFVSAVEKYIDIKRPVLSPSTVREYSRCAKIVFPKIFPENISLKDFSQAVIQKGISQYSIDHSPKSVMNLHGLISAVLKMFKPEFSLNTTLPKKKMVDIYVPSNEEIKELLSYVKDTELEKAIMLAAFGSLRRGEVCALTSSDLNGNVVSINKSMAHTDDKEHRWVVKPPKTYSGYRKLELPDFVIEKIKDCNGRIVNCNPDVLTLKFRKALIDTGIHHFRFHDLRHYQASILHAMGIPDKYIIARGGWQSEETLKKIYQHTMEQKRIEVEDKICSYFQKEYSDLIKEKAENTTKQE